MKAQPHPQARSLVPLAVMLAVCIVFFGAAGALQAHTIDKHFPVQPHPVISVHNLRGTIVVKAWDKPEVYVTANHPSPKVEVEAEQNANRIELTTHILSEDTAPEELQADYEVMVPEETELQIHDDSGLVTIVRVIGDLTVETIGAGISIVDTGGSLTVRTVDGAFDCLRCGGRIEIFSIGGDMKLLENRSSAVYLQTTSGSILFDGDFLTNGTYTLKNATGNTDVRFLPSDSIDLTAISLQGKVNSEFNLTPPAHPTHNAPRRASSLFGKVNSGMARVELTSLSGTINIRKRE
ncbi:MAG: DUF4097 family beta strand repeat-containing protein [Candidatus Acidiferrales bacterium]